jgi:hypothetical protein
MRLRDARTARTGMEVLPDRQFVLAETSLELGDAVPASRLDDPDRLHPMPPLS